ncbi:hypothetical protein [Streptomyces sp. NPDC005423]|uniref:hypothetical protein n=1 Tax=Streptomyces sp. NPDC005423 TaxID=3155343 RepID=UPI0033AB1AD3
MARDENMIAALKRERAVYVSQGDGDRVRQVDESLRHYGYDAEQDGPQDRTTAPQQMADAGTTPARPAARKSTAKKAEAKPAEATSSTEAQSTPPAE